MDVNLADKNTESVILHVVNNVLQDSTETDIDSFFNNVKEIAQKCYSYNTKNVFTSGLVHTEKVNVKTLDNNHDTMVSVCSQSTIKIDFNW